MLHLPYDQQSIVYRQYNLRQLPDSNMTDSRPTLLIHNSSFQNKVKRIVRTLLKTSTYFRRAPENFGINGISQVINPANPGFLRFAWGLVLFGCIIVCMFQVQNRLSHYLARPVVTDVKIEEERNVKFPSLTISSTDTAGAARLLQEHNMTVDQQSTCPIPTKILLHNARGLDANKLWSALNITPSIAMAAIFTRNQQHEVNWNEEYGVYGTQIRFEQDKFLPYEGMESKFTVKVTKQIPSCKGGIILGSVQPNGMPSDRKNSFLFKTLSSHDFLIAVKKFAFLNRTNQICTDDTSYLQCKLRCEAKHFRTLPCRFPFIPEEVNIPTCVSSPGLGVLYGQTLMTFRTLYCHCPRRCKETVFRISKRYVQENEHFSMLSMYLITNHGTVITERFAYDTITFLGDIGGMLGLCLGLSLLSIFDVLHKLASYVIKGLKNKREEPQLFHEYPFLGLIKRLLSEELYGYRSCKQSLKTNTVASPIWQMILVIIIISCILGSCLFIFIRISKYWCEPTHMAVEIINKDTVHFPNVTICGLSRQIVIWLRDLGRQREKIRHTSFKPELNLWCTLKLTDLLDDPTMSAEKVWEESTIFTELENSIDLGKMMLNKSIIENIAMREVSLPNGKCVEIHIGQQLYVGYWTQFGRIFESQAFLDFESELIACDRNYHEIFVTPPEESLHFSTRLEFPVGKATWITVEPKQVTLLNTRRNPCMEEKLAKECHTRCLQAKLDKSISCRLPYMPSAMKNLPICNSSKAAEKAQSTYMTHALTFNPLQHERCGCIKSCRSTFLSHSVSFDPHAFGKRTVVSMFFSSNIYEHIVEIPSDSLSSLLCDIGGNLGLTLGASLLSLFDIVQSMLVKLLRRPMFNQRAHVTRPTCT